MVLHLCMEMSWRRIIICWLLSSHCSVAKTHPDGRTSMRAREQFSVGAAFLWLYLLSRKTISLLFHITCSHSLSKKSHCKPSSWIPSHTHSVPSFTYLQPSYFQGSSWTVLGRFLQPFVLPVAQGSSFRVRSLISSLGTAVVLKSVETFDVNRHKFTIEKIMRLH